MFRYYGSSPSFVFCSATVGNPAQLCELLTGLAPEAVTEEALSAELYTAGQPDPDLIIRTSGEMRLSGYLLWQSAYSEFAFPETLWPDFSPAHLDAILDDYQNRTRRFGLTGEQLGS